MFPALLALQAAQSLGEVGNRRAFEFLTRNGRYCSGNFFPQLRCIAQFNYIISSIYIPQELNVDIYLIANCYFLSSVMPVGKNKHIAVIIHNDIVFAISVGGRSVFPI